ncbi:MAG: flagellar basal body-associated FliL family protein [Oligoflexales bacterium]|nr:flagellar basal body-associated FliL family protein [Oligoflexales bacterium]
MADDNEEKTEEEEQEGGAKGGSKKLIFILVGVLVLLGVGGGAAFFLMAGGDDKPAQTSSEGSSNQDGEGQSEAAAADSEGGQNEGEEAEAPTGAAGALKQATTPKEENTFVDINFGATYQLKPFHSNLGNPLENRYLRLEIAFEYKQGEEQRKEIEARLPQLRDAVLSVASRKTREFLLGPDGKDQLRLEILNRVNQFMDKKIESIFITDMLIE